MCILYWMPFFIFSYFFFWGAKLIRIVFYNFIFFQFFNSAFSVWFICHSPLKIIFLFSYFCYLEGEKWRRELVRDITKKISAIQNGNYCFSVIWRDKFYILHSQPQIIRLEWNLKIQDPRFKHILFFSYFFPCLACLSLSIIL